MRKIDKARSLEDGIVFYSSKIPFFGIKSELKNNGRIENSPVFTPFEDFANSAGPSEMNIVKIVRIVVCVLYFALAIYFLDGGLITSALFFTFLVSKKLVFLLYQAFCIHVSGSKKSFGRFHAAEHMAVGAYNSLGKVPTLSEVKKYSKLSEHCGSMFMINDVILGLNVCMVGILYTRFGFFLGLTLAILTTFLLFFAKEKNAFLFVQNLVLSKATDTELQVAIDGLKFLEECEKDFSNNRISTEHFEYSVIPICIELDE